MRRYVMLSATLLTVLTTGHLAAQTETNQTPVLAPTVQLSPAEKDFDEIVRNFEKRLTEAGSFTADVVSQWETAGGGDAKGTNIFRVAVQAGGKLRVEAGSAEAGEAQFVCVSDGRGITRLLRSAKLYSQHEAATTLDELQHDNMTLQSLAGSGVEFLGAPAVSRSAHCTDQQRGRRGPRKNRQTWTRATFVSRCWTSRFTTSGSRPANNRC